MRRLRAWVNRPAAVLIASTIIAQSIALGATPILSRIYPPEAFGYLTLVVSVTAIAVPMIALRFESALMLPVSTRSATALLAVGAISVLVVSAIVVTALEVAFGLGAFSNMSSLPGFSWWVGGISFTSGIFVLLGQFALRAHRYASVARRNVTQASVTAAAQIGSSLLGVSPIGLVGGYAAGRIAGLVPLAVTLRRLVVPFSLHDMRNGLIEYRQFPLVYAPSALLNSSALMIPVVYAGVWFDVSDAGQWGMAERILALPFVIVATAIGQVVEARLAQNYRDRVRGATVYYLRISGILAIFSIIVTAVVVVAAPIVVPWVLGPGWEDAALIMQLMAPMVAARLVASPLSKVFVTFRRAGLNLLMDALRFVAVAGVVVAATFAQWTLFETVSAVSLAFAVVYICTWVAGLMIARQFDTEVSRSA